MNNLLKPLILGDLEVKVPIFQGGMGVKVSTASLASAVANAGGAGTIASVGLAYGTKDNETNYQEASLKALIKEIREARRLTDGVIGVNVMVALSNYEDLVKTASKEKIDFIVSGAGLPLKLPEFVENSSIKLIPIVSSARAARIIIKTWNKKYNRFPDAIVAEGPMAGGHLGFKMEDLESNKAESIEDIVIDLVKLTKEYKEKFNVNIPIIPAGGIFDGKDMVKFLKLGAQGVQMGTRFVATDECSVAREFKNLYIKAKEEDIILIKSPVGMPGKVIKTKFIDLVNQGKRIPIKCKYRCLKSCNPNTAPYCIAKALFNAVIGNLDEAIVFSGSNASKVKKIVPVKELIDSIIKEALEELN